MVFDGYLSLGGNEVINNERARLVAASASCPMHWFKGDRCSSLQVIEAQDYSDVTKAPWYDPVLEESSRFYGAFALAVQGLPDSTVSATTTQNLGSGGSVDAIRDATREVRVRALLTAQGADALDYGMAWLNSALKPGACGQHASECGLTDLGFWAECPPVRGVAYDYTAMTERRRNLMSDPRGTSTSSAFWSTPANGTYSLRTDMLGDVPTAVRWTATATTAGRISMISGTTTPQGPARITFKAQVRSSHAMTVTVRARPTVTSATGEVLLATINLAVGLNTIDVDGVSFTAATTSASGVVITPGTVVVGATLDVTKVMIAALGGEYFDGDTPNVEDDQGVRVAEYAWVGTPNASQSTYSTKVRTERPQTDLEWLESQFRLRRYLHDVAKTSGPLVVGEVKSGSIVGYFIEFVITAERPWVFSETQEMSLPGLTPIVVQDIPYNLAKYPSAETAAAGTFLVATNYCTNPSVEANANNWNTWQDGVGITAGLLGARSTELAAVGVASFKVAFTPAVSGGPGAFGAEIIVTVPEVTGSPVSVTEWGAVITTVATGLTLGTRTLTLVWRAATTVLRTDVIGTGPATGGSISGNGIFPPATATNCIVRHQINVTAYTAASRCALYVDALAVSRP